MLTDSAILAPGALDARARNLRGEPHTHAHFKAESPQHVYTVRFDSHELWGAGAEPFAITIELYESYLEKTT